MLRIDLGALRQGPIDMAQAVPADDPLFERLEFEFGGPVHLSGRLMDAGAGCYYWRGEIRARVRAACRRCLVPVDVEVAQPVGAFFTEEANAEDAAAYIIQRRAAGLDLSEAVREELILAMPEYVLCQKACRGICPRCGEDLNRGECECKPEPDPRWAPLEALKAARHGDERN